MNNLTGIIENESLLRVWVTQRDITERRQAEEALRISETRLRTMFEQSLLSIQILSPDGRTLQVNQAWERLWGVTLEDIAGYNLLEDQQLVDKGVMPYIQRGFSGEPTLIPPIVYDPDETIPDLSSHGEPKRWVRAFIYPVKDEAGKVREVILMHEDITERKQAEEELKNSERRLSLAVESTGLGTWDFNPMTRDLRWDERCKAMFELSPEAEVDYELFLAGLHPEDRECTVRAVKRSLDPDSGGSFEIEYRTVGIEDGVERWVVSRGQAFFDEAGRAVRFVGTVLDITERKKNEEALKQSERLYRAVIEQAIENIFLVDVETRCIVESNPAFREALGYTEVELKDMTLYDIVAADRMIIDANVQRVLGKDTYVGERKYRRKDDTLVDVEVSASTILHNGRETLCVVAHDITERKKNEEAQRFLAEASASLSSSLDYRATLAQVARLAVPHLADWYMVDILEEDDSLHRLAVAHEDPKKVALAHELQARYPPDPDASQGVLQVLRTGELELGSEIPEAALDEAACDAEHRRILKELGLRSYIIVPLVARGRTLGAITLVSAESGWRYGAVDLKLAEELARRAALAVDNARLYRGRSEVAHTLQQGLLPSRLAKVPGVEVGLRYLSVGEVDVGGDFYDLFEERILDQNSSSAPSSSWGVVIGDVSGKGAEAAAVLALARYTIRAMAMGETRPSTILAHLNEIMLRQSARVTIANFALLPT